ncbi:MAG: cation-translocating P-type ATPase [Coriobacteriia bacterium]|nr:cation-translocating P-type ATPase [Coriobacteriia bacterium]
MKVEQINSTECQNKWYEHKIEAILGELKVDPQAGLSEERVTELQAAGGKNVLEEEKKEGFIRGVLRHLSDRSIIILLVAAGLSYYMAFTQHDSDFIKGSVILGIVILNLFLAMTQEGKAERALAALEEMTSPDCTVIRDGQRVTMDTSELVPGDIIVLKTGDIVPADARLIESASLFSDESALTGESEAAEKDASADLSGTLLPGDQANMVFSSTVITAGNGLAVVVATGMDTQMGRIAHFLKGGKRSKTPLQKRLDGLGGIISWVAIVSAVFLFALGIMRGADYIDMIMVAIALAVAAVPEMLALTVTLTLTTAVQRMAKKNALIRKLPAVETLGNASVICSDKTGTLTLNQMTITQLWCRDEGVFGADSDFNETQKMLIKGFGRASNAKIEMDADGKKQYFGDATEVGIMKLLDSKDLYGALKYTYKRIAEIPFSSERKKMSVILKDERDGKYVVLTKGALDWLPLCPESSENLTQARKVHDEFAGKALRVLAIAGKRFDELPNEEDLDSVESDLNLFGMIGLIDPPRPEALEAVKVAKCAGIRTVMITGDHAITAKAIAEELDILDEGQCVVTGAELADMSDEYLNDHVKEYSVYARVSPEDKLRIVKSWQKNDAVVAMTGDGVNDAPALNVADVGVAMGITGTEVAKGASDMILTDDNFATIVDAIREGRNVFRIVKKVILFLFACNLSEVAIMLIGQVAGWGLILTPIMLLLINVVGDGIPGLRLANEPANPNLMDREPVKRGESFFGGGIAKFLTRQVIFFTISGLLGYWYGAFLINDGYYISQGMSDPLGQTLAFLAIGWSSILHIFNVRSSKSIFRKSVRDNWPLFWAAIGMIVLFGAFIVLEPFQHIFALTPLSAEQWFWGMLIALIPTALRELFVHIDRLLAARAKKRGTYEQGLDLG